MELDSDWHTKDVRSRIRGIQKALGEKFWKRFKGALRLKGSSPLLRQVVQLADKEGSSGFVDLCALGYAFLLRLRSEGLPLESGRGRPGEEFTDWRKEGRHSAAFLSEDGSELRVWLFRRKNKLGGSILIRKCS